MWNEFDLIYVEEVGEEQLETYKRVVDLCHMAGVVDGNLIYHVNSKSKEEQVLQIREFSMKNVGKTQSHTVRESWSDLESDLLGLLAVVLRRAVWKYEDFYPLVQMHNLHLKNFNPVDGKGRNVSDATALCLHGGASCMTLSTMRDFGDASIKMLLNLPMERSLGEFICHGHYLETYFPPKSMVVSGVISIDQGVQNLKMSEHFGFRVQCDDEL